MTFTTRTLFQTIGLLVAGSVLVTQAQDPARSAPPEKRVTSARRVWTNDDLQSLRKPSSDEDQKGTAADTAGKVGAESPAKAAVAEPAPSPRNSGIAMPKTLEETDRSIDKTTKAIRNREMMIHGAENALESAPEEQRAELKQEIDSMKSKVEDDKGQLKNLQAHHEELERVAQQGDQSDQNGGQNDQNGQKKATPGPS